jgi:HK97 family phage prohead protease
VTMHRALGYVDRAAVREGSPLRVILATEGRKGDGIDLRMSGADLGRFRANPVLGYGHSYWGRGNLPIGRVAPESLAIDGTSLAGDLEFDPADEFARTVERKMRDGYLSAVSIGFEVTQWESAEHSYWKGGVATKWELSELSVVPVPMDADAVVTAGRAGAITDPGFLELLKGCSEEEFVRLVARARMILGPAEPIAPDVEDVTPETPSARADGITTDAAQGLLSAFNL